MYQAKVTNSEPLKIVFEGANVIVNGEKMPWDLVKISGRHYHLITGTNGFSIEILEVDRENKSVSLKINNIIQDVEVKNDMDLLLEKMGIDHKATGAIRDVKAPMPGLILEVMVKPGDEVEAGQKLLILEAMKMENVIKSPVHGKIKEVHAEPQTSIEKNQVLISFEV